MDWILLLPIIGLPILAYALGYTAGRLHRAKVNLELSINDVAGKPYDAARHADFHAGQGW